MYFIQFITLQILLVAAFAEVSEKEMHGLKKVFCEEKYKDVAEAMKECFESVKPSEEGEAVIKECCEGMEVPVTGDSVQVYACSHSPDEMMECMNCQNEKFEAAGKKDDFKSVLEPLKECMKEKFAEGDEE